MTPDATPFWLASCRRHLAALPFEDEKIAADRDAHAAARLLRNVDAEQFRQPIDRRFAA